MRTCAAPTRLTIAATTQDTEGNPAAEDPVVVVAPEAVKGDTVLPKEDAVTHLPTERRPDIATNAEWLGHEYIVYMEERNERHSAAHIQRVLAEGPQAAANPWWPLATTQGLMVRIPHGD